MFVNSKGNKEMKQLKDIRKLLKKQYKALKELETTSNSERARLAITSLDVDLLGIANLSAAVSFQLETYRNIASLVEKFPFDEQICPSTEDPIFAIKALAIAAYGGVDKVCDYRTANFIKRLPLRSTLITEETPPAELLQGIYRYRSVPLAGDKETGPRYLIVISFKGHNLSMDSSHHRNTNIYSPVASFKGMIPEAYTNLKRMVSEFILTPKKYAKLYDDGNTT